MPQGISELNASTRGGFILGEDIARDLDGDIDLQSGIMRTTTGEVVAMHDIGERIKTALGTEFYDNLFGCNVEDMIEAPDTPENRLQILVELQAAIQADPRVYPKSARAEIRYWTDNPRIIRVKCYWLWRIDQVEANLVVSLTETDGLQVVIESYRPTTAAQEA